MLQSSNHVGDGGAAGLGHALRVSGSLQKLFLVRLSPVVFELLWLTGALQDRNRISDVGAVCLGEALKVNRGLRYLNLVRPGLFFAARVVCAALIKRCRATNSVARSTSPAPPRSCEAAATRTACGSTALTGGAVLRATAGTACLSLRPKSSPAERTASFASSKLCFREARLRPAAAA